MFKYVLLVALFIQVLAGSAFAQMMPQMPRCNDPTMAFIVNKDTGGGIGCTCGTVINIEDLQFVITCAHDTHFPMDKVQLQFANGKTAVGTSIGYDHVKDVSLVQIMGYRHPHASKVATVAPRLPCVGVSSGFPQAQVFRVRKGYVKDCGYIDPRTGGPGPLEFTGGAYHGESGGPVRNLNGEIIGVISATDGSGTIIASWRSVKELVDATHRRVLSYKQQRQQPRQLQYAQCPDGNCPGGVCQDPSMMGGGATDGQIVNGASPITGSLTPPATDPIPFGGPTNPDALPDTAFRIPARR